MPKGVSSILTLAVILALTLSPAPEKAVHVPLFPGADKIVHFLMFGFLCWIILFEADNSSHKRTHRLILTAIVTIVVSLIGLAIEFLQEAMNCGRSYDFNDFIADTAGAFTGAIINLCSGKQPTHSNERQS